MGISIGCNIMNASRSKTARCALLASTRLGRVQDEEERWNINLMD